MSRDPNTLSRVQREIMDIVHRFDQENGRPPSLRDIARQRKCAVNAVYQQVLVIEKKGHLMRMHGRIVTPRAS